MKVTPKLQRPVLKPCTLESFQYQVDPYVGCGHLCHYCYVLPQAVTDWSHEVLTYEDIDGRLRSELARLPPQTIYLGWHTDPYQPVEADLKQTRRVLEALLEHGFSASILTKSDLVLRDTDLLKEMNDAAVSVSVAFNRERVRRLFEAGAMETRKRISALAQLASAGIRTRALICPVIPFITDVPAMLEQLAPWASKIWVYGLSFADRSTIGWKNVERCLSLHFEHVKEQTEAAVFDRQHPYWADLKQALFSFQKTRHLNLSVHI